jgi:hypothetical protein
MSKERNIIARFAVLGFALAAGGAAFQVLTDSLPPTPINWPLVSIFVLLCPASILAVPLSVMFFEAAETGTPLFYAIWALVALVNAVLYSVAGSAWLDRRQKPSGSAAT